MNDFDLDRFAIAQAHTYAAALEADPLLGTALEHFFRGEGDPRTLALLDAHDGA